MTVDFSVHYYKEHAQQHWKSNYPQRATMWANLLHTDSALEVFFFGFFSQWWSITAVQSKPLVASSMTYIFWLLSLSLFDCTFNLITSAWQNFVFANFETFRLLFLLLLSFLLRSSDSHTPYYCNKVYRL